MKRTTQAVLVALMAAAASGHTDAQQAAEVRATIVSPKAGEIVVGPVQLIADVNPVDAVASATFFVGGSEVCVIPKAPFSCNWDAGRDPKERQIRLVVTLNDGRPRVVTTVRTTGIEYFQAAQVDAVQVTVTISHEGKFVQGLPQKAFRVWEDGKAQALNSFVAEDVPLELVVAVDISGSMADAMPQLKRAVKDFLAAVPSGNQVTLLGFNDSIITVTRRSTDPAERIRAVDRLAPWGATALYDVIARGVDLLDQQTGRKALVVFTDGEDRGSQISLAAAEQRLQSSDVTLYMIGQGRGVSTAPLRQIMQRLADPTGGRALSTDSIDKLHEAFEELLDELSHQYLLGYQSTNGARDGTWRELKVEVDGPGRVRARTGYRASQEK